MKRQELLRYLNGELIESLFGFCYARTNDSVSAQELCSDIVFALVKAVRTEGGEIDRPYPFIWRVARNVYADYSAERRKKAEVFIGESGSVPASAVAENDDTQGELLKEVYRRIAFLTKAYRETMILYYLDGLSTAEIAKRLCAGEAAVRQRLFSARQKIKNEVNEMTAVENRPMSLKKIDFDFWGSGDPAWGDPRTVCKRQFSKHVVALLNRKPMSAGEIAEELNVPTVYVEDELELLTLGENGQYGLLRKTENGKYAVNFILMEENTIQKARSLYSEPLSKNCDILTRYAEDHREEYLSFPYLNRRVDLNLILWQQINRLYSAFISRVETVLARDYFPEFEEKPVRPFSVFGYINSGTSEINGCGWDGVSAENVCGFSEIHLNNIYNAYIQPHFHCGLNVSKDPQIQLALRSIEGLKIPSLSEADQEHAAKAIEQGYLYREGDTLYTKILVCSIESSQRLFSVSDQLNGALFEDSAKAIAEKIASLIRKTVQKHLLGEWRYANTLASMPFFNAIVEAFIEKGLLTPPENGIGAEGCWMCVSK